MAGTSRHHKCRSMWQLLKKVRHSMKNASYSLRGEHGLAKV
ncbi:hypothetical protein HMPREF1621_01265 [Escherichia coli A25922R]|uniref:Uncharacterized protein n=2 Tax=Escherichia coli TaxID=562 RepID=A0A0H2V5U4_ECOL6|nr:Hypothetical protein c0077 [Escherichia coli CFT073]ABE05580.1 hypothetical protein UTI89_C0070 [Escherichia coli UTI89]AER82665.1 hypothetical protein i02_0067 [Escherichia coli str. 'clone D i2']AER87584.1 hypothetical protein i14_0067 [Escherichia coli str. 'clone D i14']AJB37873.1 hypothetical protein L282_2911 [Escherichia coli APEC IMT5155]ASO86569.1 hypothetical protein AKO63_0065 [Escherichia coli]EEJ48329.1 hypothetical protein HMPREF0358_1626 [Escherichia coli 83972]EFJ56129.1 h